MAEDKEPPPFFLNQLSQAPPHVRSVAANQPGITYVLPPLVLLDETSDPIRDENGEPLTEPSPIATTPDVPPGDGAFQPSAFQRDAFQSIAANWDQPQPQQPQRSPSLFNDPPAGPPFPPPAKNEVALSARGQATGFGRAEAISTQTVAAEGGGRSRTVVLLEIETLLVIIRNEIKVRRELRINDDPELQDLEQFEREAENLKNRTVDAKASADTVAEANQSFGKFVRDWFERSHEKILDKSFELVADSSRIGLFLISTSVCHNIGVNVDLGATICGAIAGGKPVADAIAAYFGKEKKK